MHNPEYVLENETHKLLWVFEIQTDRLMSARRPDFIKVNKKKKKKKESNCGLYSPSKPLSKIERKRKKDKYLDLTREFKKFWNMKVMFIPILIGVLGTVTGGLVQGLEDLEIRG